MAWIGLLILPSAYMLAAVLALLQFQVILTLLQQGAIRIKSVGALSAVAPFIGGLSDHFVKVFGQPHKFVPQPTHVILVALMMAVIIHLERSRR